MQNVIKCFGATVEILAYVYGEKTRNRKPQITSLKLLPGKQVT